jgi:hypothetical protein
VGIKVPSYVVSSQFESGLGDLTEVIYLTVIFCLFWQKRDELTPRNRAVIVKLIFTGLFKKSPEIYDKKMFIIVVTTVRSWPLLLTK